MKNLFKIGLLSVALMTSVVANAVEKIKVEVLGSKSLNVSLSEVSTGVSISIVDTNELVLFSDEVIKVGSFIKKFDLSNLPNGLYYLKTKTVDKINITPFVVDADKAKVIKGDVKTFNTPKFDFKNDVLRVSMDNPDMHDVSIIIYPKESSVAIADEKINAAKIVKNYRFKSLPYTEYNVVMYQGGYSYVKTIKR
ncbi:hypothetical protein [Aquimarina agarivorans]|uniref:hypothetical protein n=1 Tax=Aquimarina agarivorans TaxID=980584 RepID=UPI000248ED73|nr:hypothetical protein [Aquimarina agarivorans]